MASQIDGGIEAYWNGDQGGMLVAWHHRSILSGALGRWVFSMTIVHKMHLFLNLETVNALHLLGSFPTNRHHLSGLVYGRPISSEQIATLETFSAIGNHFSRHLKMAMPVMALTGMQACLEKGPRVP